MYYLQKGLFDREEDEPKENYIRLNKDYEVEVYYKGEWLLIDKYYELNKTKKK